jgi:membrane protein DedA with SNARE-associated domain
MDVVFIVFLIVFGLNVIPAFAPPTWMVFSFLGFRFSDHMDWTIALTGALAATLGRSLLAKLARVIARRHWLSDASRESVDVLKVELEKRPKFTFGLFLFFAFTPLPSNSVFIAYGLTTLNLLRIAVPFFIGRFVSYSFWAFSAAAVSRKMELESTEALGYFSLYFVISQLALLGLVYAFTRVDWPLLIRERKWKWLPKHSASLPKPPIAGDS